MDRTGGFYPSHAGSIPARISFKSINGMLAKWPCAWPQTMRRGFESRTYLQFTPAKPDSFRAASQGLYATSLSESLARQTLQSGPKSPPTCSRVGLAWVRLASSLALLQRRQAMRGGSRFPDGYIYRQYELQGVRGGRKPSASSHGRFDSCIADHF